MTSPSLSIDPLPTLPPASVMLPLRTVARSVTWEGAGLHSGQTSRVTVEPNEEAGIFFVSDETVIPATADHVLDTTRCTVLGKDGSAIATVEHLLAALTGLGIWSVRIEVTGPEIPILDGSAAPFVESLLDAGMETIGEIAAVSPEAGSCKEGNVERHWRPASALATYAFFMSGGHPMLSGQEASHELSDTEGFAREIAPCRTWAPIEQVQPLLDQGLIRGGTLENALVVYPDRYSSELRRENEPARHKLLDLIGDLALIGRPLCATIQARGGGHTHNARLAGTLRGP